MIVVKHLIKVCGGEKRGGGGGVDIFKSGITGFLYVQSFNCFIYVRN